MPKRKQPHFHPRLQNDAEFILKAYRSQFPLGIDVESTRTHIKIKDMIKAWAGEHFDVVDVSLEHYAGKVRGAPLELSIVDHERRDGFPPGTDFANLPQVYDPTCVANVLVETGHEGSFYSPRPSNELPTFEDRHQHPLLARDLTSPWPHLKRTPELQLLYPTQLLITSPQPFSLTLPGPTLQPLHALVKSYSRLPCVSDMISLLYIWTRSLQMTEFTPLCLALMAIHSLQRNNDLFENVIHRVVTLQSGEKERSVWVLREFLGPSANGLQWSTEPVSLNIASTHGKPLYGQNLQTLLFQFFSRWRSVMSWATMEVVSIQKSETVKRQAQYQPIDVVPDIKGKATRRHSNATADGVLPFDTQPRSWQYSPLVIQDPFVHTHNHAAGVSRDTLRYFAYNCAIAAKDLGSSHPLMSIPGMNLPTSTLNTISSQRSSAQGTASGSGPHSHSVGYRRFETLELPTAVLQARLKTVQRVQEAIRKEFGRMYQVELFGSTRYGASVPSSDLDLVIIDPDRPSGFAPSVNLNDLPSVYNIKKLGKAIQSAGFVKVQTIPSAKVPIVKFTDPTTRLDCDVNVNDQLGLFNTLLINRYCDMLPVLRSLIMVIKQWAKPLGLNSSSIRNGPVTFSSYAFMLMTIGRLQMRGLLPNLQEGLSEAQENDTDGFFWPRHSGRIKCDTRFNYVAGWAPEEEVQLDELLLDWFNYWGVEHRYQEDLMSIRHAGLGPRKMAPKTSDTRSSRQGRNRGDEAKTQTSTSPGTSKDPKEEFHEDHEDEQEDGEDLVDLEGLDNHDEVATDSLMDKGEEPARWITSSLIVVDPFIRSRNVTGNIGRISILRFRKDCQRAATMLRWGASLEELVGPDDNQIMRGHGTGRTDARGRGQASGRGRGGRRITEGGMSASARDQHVRQRGAHAGPSHVRRGTDVLEQR